MRLYKYREVGSDLSKDYALDALLNSYAIFSSRKNFNDLFDSKINLPHPSAAEIENLLRRPNINSNAAMIRGWITNGQLTPRGLSDLNKFEKAFDETIDGYPIFCLSELADDDQLWAHYAGSHTGFCIEFEFSPPQPKPQRVSYKDKLESVPLLNFIEVFCIGGDPGLVLGDRILAALHVKIKKWENEHEYRLLAGNAMGRILTGTKFKKVPYDPSWVKAIIFGCRTTDEVKSYIRRNLPYASQFKQAIEVKDHIEIIDC